MAAIVTREAVEVVTTRESDRWKRILQEVGSYDYYHLPEFHRLAEIRGGGEAIMPVFHRQGYAMAYPLMIREIDIPPLIKAEEGYRDASSAPGLIGPVASSPEVPDDIRLALMQQFREFLKENRIITVYSRLNCFFKQREFLREFGDICDMGVEVSIDLTKPPDVQFADYTRGHRKQIRKLRNLGFTVIEVGTNYLDQFMELYFDTMDKVHASPAYYFDRSYFEFLLSEMSEIMHMFAVMDGSTVTSIGINCVCNGIIHNLYAGAVEEYRHLSPTKLRIDAVREWGNEIGAHTLHLGGSLGGREDPLHQFKMGFGGREHTYSVWKYVADQEVYDYLCREVCRHSDTEPDDTFFPEYRNPNLQLNTTANC